MRSTCRKKLEYMRHMLGGPIYTGVYMPTKAIGELAALTDRIVRADVARSSGQVGI